MVLLALRGLPHGRTILSKTTLERQSLLNSHRQSRWITVDLGVRDKLKRTYIGIGSLLAEAPSHTTGHTGPYPAVRLIKADQELSIDNPNGNKQAYY